eukprot:3419731-Prymnesium_polylepis.1
MLQAQEHIFEMKQQIDTSWMAPTGSTGMRTKLPQQFATRAPEAQQLRLSLEEVRPPAGLPARPAVGVRHQLELKTQEIAQLKLAAPILGKIHLKARSKHPLYPERTKVPDAHVDWRALWPAYTPVAYTAPVVKQNDRTHVDCGWAVWTMRRPEPASARPFLLFAVPMRGCSDARLLSTRPNVRLPSTRPQPAVRLFARPAGPVRCPQDPRGVVLARARLGGGHRALRRVLGAAQPARPHGHVRARSARQVGAQPRGRPDRHALAPREPRAPDCRDQARGHGRVGAAGRDGRRGGDGLGDGAARV